MRPLTRVHSPSRTAYGTRLRADFRHRWSKYARETADRDELSPSNEASDLLRQQVQIHADLGAGSGNTNVSFHQFAASPSLARDAASAVSARAWPPFPRGDTAHMRTTSQRTCPPHHVAATTDPARVDVGDPRLLPPTPPCQHDYISHNDSPGSGTRSTYRAVDRLPACCGLRRDPPSD